ncbi:Nucleolar protein 12, partial [Quaeritorhiza haematococci]
AFAKIINRKIAFKGKMFHPERDTCNCYIVYEDAEALEEAAKLNGTVFMGKHLRVDRATSSKESYDTKRAVFLGNLPFDVAEEDIWTFFEERVGEVEYVRVIRDSVTNVGKGFGYVGFKDRASVGLALKLNEQEFKERQLRVERCSKRLSQGQKNAPASSRRQPVRLPKLKGKKQNPAVARIQAKKKKMKRK